MNAQMERGRVSMRSSLAELYRQLSARRRRQFGMLLCLMLVGAVGEFVSIGAVLPFLPVIADPQGVMQHARVQGFLHVFGIDTPVQIAVAALAAAAARLLLVYVSQRFVFGLARDLSVAIYDRTLCQRARDQAPHILDH
jgi:ATP-binding cassette subfamily B protein